MWKKAFGILLGSLVVVGLTSVIYLWANRAGNGIGEVGWSPLYASRERSALAPVTSQVAYGAGVSLAAPITCVGAATCDTTCAETCGPTCQSTCRGPTCDTTCDKTCETTCDEYTCDRTCEYTCERTCDGYTCEGTCDEYTCDKTCSDTCERTCDGYTCEGTCEGETCDATCGGWTCEETCVGETCEGSTCDGGTCEGLTCPIPTCTGRTCVGPTCAGFATCDRSCDVCVPMTMLRTCAGPTCDGPSCGDRTCDPWDCEFPTFDAATCSRPTCDGPTCDGPTCDGGTCFATACELWDFGDAPDRSISVAYRYLTRLQDDGARHLVDGVYYLGVRIDEEPDGQPNDEALGDDVRPWSIRDDEDGVWFPTSLIPGRQAILIADASEEGFFHGWIDYDENGDWKGEEPVERLFDPSLPLQKGFNWIAFEVPEDADAPETSYARFRFGRQQAMADAGEARNGEVEDYRAALCPAYDVWIMTDDIVYRPGEEVLLDFYVNDVSQIEVIRHRADGTSSLLWAGTVEPGRQKIRDHGGVLRALTLGTETIEMIATSLPTGCSTWVTTPFVVVEP